MAMNNNLRKALKTVSANRMLIFLSFILLIGASIAGFFLPDVYEGYSENVMDSMLSKVQDMNAFEITLFIILNNLFAALLMVLLGIIFFPIFGIISNGYIIGSVLRTATGEIGFFAFFMLIPHGILEIPAFCISLGLGLSIGLEWFRKRDFAKRYKEAFLAFIYIVIPLLMIAGIIEGFLISLVI